MTFTVAVSGDSILNRRVSTCDDEQFIELIDVFRGADVAFTHFESVIHDYDGPEVYPAAEAGGTWMRSPYGIADELAWMGIDLVSHASNHALDYSYGALRSTWDYLEHAGVTHAGTGENLADAQAPAYRDTSDGRVALVSMTTSFPRSSRAGEHRGDVKGRPGVNPLCFHYSVGEETLSKVTDLADELGWWVIEDHEGVAINQPGLHNSLYKFRKSEDDHRTMVLDENDERRNLRTIADADQRADFVVVHVHTHEFRPDGDVSDPAGFLPPFARKCIARGADIVVAQGSHAPMRGVEIHDECPIFYDPGDFILMSDSVTRFPSDFYDRYASETGESQEKMLPAAALAARKTAMEKATNPPGGYWVTPVVGTTVPLCTYDEEMNLERVELHPGTWPMEEVSSGGIPLRATGSDAEAIIDQVADLSEAYDTTIEFEDGVGIVTV